MKVCGITRADDALAAEACGADALGFIFYRRSPRWISAEAAGAIIAQLPPLVARVGVFVNAPLAEVVATAGCGLSVLQLHGGESADYCKELRRALPHCQQIKALRIGPASCAADFSPYASLVDAFLLDTYLPGMAGGTGAAFDWTLIDGLALQRPFFLAGGLSPANVAEAIEAVRPYAVDINSGVELQLGVKDHSQLRALFAALP